MWAKEAALALNWICVSSNREQTPILAFPEDA